MCDASASAAPADVELSEELAALEAGAAASADGIRAQSKLS